VRIFNILKINALVAASETIITHNGVRMIHKQ